MTIAAWQGAGTRSSFGATVSSVTPAITTTSITPGDLIFIEVATKNNQTHVCSHPTQWQQVGLQINSGASFTSSLWVGRVPRVGSLPNPTFSWSGGNASGFAKSWSIQREDLDDKTALQCINVLQSAAGTGSPHTLPDSVSSAANSLIMYCGSAASNTSYGAVTNYTERVDEGSATGATRNVVGTRNLTTAGSATGAISTTGSTASWVLRLIEILEPVFVGLEVGVINSGDGQQSGTTPVTNSSPLTQGFDGTNQQRLVLRFASMTIPTGKVIKTARIKLVPTATSMTGTHWGAIYGDRYPGSSPAWDTSNPIDDSRRTAAYTPFITGFSNNPIFYDVTEQLREITTTSGWGNGNAVRFFGGSYMGEPDGSATFYASESGGSTAPRLYIEWEDAGVIPTITSNAVVTNPENTVLSHSLTADTSVTWSILTTAEDPRSWDYGKFTLSGSTLAWTGGFTRNYESPEDQGSNNVYNVVVKATDTNGKSTTQSITVTVTDVAETPTITSANYTWISENETLAHNLTADMSVTWSIRSTAQNSSSYDADQFEISGNVLRWAGNGTKDYEAPTDHDADNNYYVVVRATGSGGLWSEQTIWVEVDNELGDDGGGGGVDCTTTMVAGSMAPLGIPDGTGYYADDGNGIYVGTATPTPTFVDIISGYMPAQIMIQFLGDVVSALSSKSLYIDGTEYPLASTDYSTGATTAYFNSTVIFAVDTSYAIAIANSGGLSETLINMTAADGGSFYGWFPFFGYGSADKTTLFGGTIDCIIVEVSTPDIIAVNVQGDIRTQLTGKSISVDGTTYPLAEPLTYDGTVTFAKYSAPDFWFNPSQTYAIDFVTAGSPSFIYMGTLTFSQRYLGLRTETELYLGAKDLFA